VRVGKWINLDGLAVHICYSEPPRRKRMPEKIEWPITRKQLYQYGWSKAMKIPPRACKRCNVKIEFWFTPDKKLHPIEETVDGLFSHFATCPYADDFRRERKIAKISTQGELF